MRVDMLSYDVCTYRAAMVTDADTLYKQSHPLKYLVATTVESHLQENR